MKHRWIKFWYNLAVYLISKSPICPLCKGKGFKTWTEKIDNITMIDRDEYCVECDGLGKAPLNLLTKFAINRIPD